MKIKELFLNVKIVQKNEKDKLCSEKKTTNTSIEHIEKLNCIYFLMRTLKKKLKLINRTL